MSESQLLRNLQRGCYDSLKAIKERLIPRDVEFPREPDKIKLLTGVRRSGKTHLLYERMLLCLEEGAHLTNLFYINFEDSRLLPMDEEKLARLIEAFYAMHPENHEQKCFFFFDGIQAVPNWPLIIKRLHEREGVEITLTCCSAQSLSRDLEPHLKGSYVKVEIWPYSFREFMRAKGLSFDGAQLDRKSYDKIAHLFMAYLSEGGFPELVTCDPDMKQKRLQDYIDLLIYKDIALRHQARNPHLIKQMMSQSIGKALTVNKFYKDVKELGYQTGKESLYCYLDYIEEAYLAFPVELYDESLRKRHMNPKKLYGIDPGLAKALSFDYEKDQAKVFENVIYLELRRLGCKAHYYLTKDRQEVDFLFETPSGAKKLFQIVWSEEARTLAKKRRALESAMEELKIPGEMLSLESFLREGISFR